MGYGGVAFIQPPGGVPLSNYLHRTLIKRMAPLASCQAFAWGQTFWFFAPKKAATYYFIKFAVGSWSQPPNMQGWGWTQIPGKFACFFLGRFPVYYDELHGGFKYAHEIGATKGFPIGPKFAWPGYDNLIFEQISPDRWDLYLPKIVIDVYKANQIFWQTWIQRQDDCIARNYERERLYQSPYVYTPMGKLPWTGIPMQSMTLPQPESIPAPGSTPEETAAEQTFPRLHMLLEYAVNDIRNSHTLTLTLW